MSNVVCVTSEGFPSSLDVGKLYRTLPDREAERYGQRRVIDESGEDYLFPRRYFVDVRLPSAAKRALASASSDRP